jgi:predicted DsbA family dithiol-disulfide isomerase
MENNEMEMDKPKPKPELKVSVFSDYICPFCYIGSRRLLRLREDFDLKVNWCGLEIHPETPAMGIPIDALGYAPERWSQMMQALTRMAQDEHIVLAERTFTTNSRLALLLSEAAKHAGQETFYALHERLFRAFFTEGRNIGDIEVLTALATECGVPAATLTAAWEDPAYPQRLGLNLRFARELGIRGTPAYVFGEKVLVGALPYTELLDAARQLSADSR